MESHRQTPQRRFRGSALVSALLIGCAALAISGAGPAKKPIHPARTPVSNREYQGMALVMRIYFKPLPEQMPGRDEKPAMVTLGRKLFFEKGISLAKSQACNDCHRLDHQMDGVDYKPTSKGDKGAFGKRNAPTVLNAGFQVVQFWDGRALDLVEQAKGPVLNPVEMGMRSPEDVVKRLKSDGDYPRLFAQAFPRQPDPVTFNNMAYAIAAFERTLVTPARFDRYLKGEKTALTRGEERGLERFVNTGCIECHNSYTVGGRSLQKFGVYHAYSNSRDLGRYGVTRRPEDKFIFKVPMLRNVALTKPYFHDGKVATLQEAVRRMAWMQLNTKLNPQQVNEVVTFLRALNAERKISVPTP